MRRTSKADALRDILWTIDDLTFPSRMPKREAVDVLEDIIVEVRSRMEALRDPRREVVIDYTNWRGERGKRRIMPIRIVYDANEWHPETQWILEAVDLEKGEERTFALANIHSWM